MHVYPYPCHTCTQVCSKGSCKSLSICLIYNNHLLRPISAVNNDNIYLIWQDCKTFYGASSLVNLPYLPIGKLKKQCDKYLQAFGPGAVVFLNGFSGDLNEHLGLSPGQVLLLDAHPVNTDTGPGGVGGLFGMQNHTSMVHKEELVSDK
jgi:hypothetical protein